MEDWSSDGCPKAENYLSRYTNDMIEDLSIRDESFAMIEKGEAFIARREWRIVSGYDYASELLDTNFQFSIRLNLKITSDMPYFCA